MKAHKFLVLSLPFFILFYKPAFSQQSGWFWANPQPQGNSLNNGYFLNTQTGFMVGVTGTILKTTNGGVNWGIQYCDSAFSMLNGVYFLNNYIGYIAGYQGKILKTTNGGNTWHNVSGDSSAGYRDVRFFNENTGVVLATGGYATGGYVSRTENGGQNWMDIPCGTSGILYSMSFKDDLTGVACGQNGTIVRTTNGGLNWSSVNSGVSVFLYGIQMLNNGSAFCAGVNGTLVKSTDSGISWNSKVSGITSDLYNLCFINDNTGVVCGYGNILYSTTNGGTNWSSFTVAFGSVLGITYDGNGSFYTASPLGDINKSTDMGISWYPLSRGDRNNITSTCFLDSSFGLIVGAPEGYVAITHNGGTSWIHTNIGMPSTNLLDVDFQNENTGITVGIYDPFGFIGFVANTTDGGLNWNQQIVLPMLNSIKFVDNNAAVAVGSDGAILRSTNAGNNWTAISTSITNSLEDIELADNVIFCVGSNGTVAKSTDYGLTWNQMYTGITNTLYGISCISANNIYVCGDGCIVLHSTNGGLNWTQQIIGTSPDLNSIFFTDPDNGWAVGQDIYGSIYHTTNGGINWFTQITRCSQTFNDVYFWDSRKGIAVGNFGCIFKTTNGGYPIGINSHNEQIPKQFKLYQNYPNPFNPSTTIKFEIPKQSIVTIRVFDILGREVQTLLNEPLRAGTYEVKWDAGSYSSGVYFYKLETPFFTESKKMILIK